jgi:small subunit ribosomal protein S7
MMHFGKKYAKNTGRMGGKKARVLNVVRTALDIIHIETGKNPVELLVRAIENASPNEDTTRIVYGGVVYHVSVDVAPLRRVDLALRFIAEGVREATYSNPQTIEEALAKEIILAANNDMASHAVKKKNEQERIAMASR